MRILLPTYLCILLVLICTACCGEAQLDPASSGSGDRSNAHKEESPEQKASKISAKARQTISSLYSNRNNNKNSAAAADGGKEGADKGSQQHPLRNSKPSARRAEGLAKFDAKRRRFSLEHSEKDRQQALEAYQKKRLSRSIAHDTEMAMMKSKRMQQQEGDGEEGRAAVDASAGPRFSEDDPHNPSFSGNRLDKNGYEALLQDLKRREEESVRRRGEFDSAWGDSFNGEETVITDPEQRKFLAEKYLNGVGHQRSMVGSSTMDGSSPEHQADQHIFGHLLTEIDKELEAITAQQRQHDQKFAAPAAAIEPSSSIEELQRERNKLKHYLFNSHPRNVQPTAPNFGLRYRVTHLVTLKFSTRVASSSSSSSSSSSLSSPLELGNVTIALFGKSVPRTVDNFIGLCNGTKGFGYVNSTIHRIIRNFIIQGGDIEFSDDGEGGHIYDAAEEEEERQADDDAHEMDALQRAFAGQEEERKKVNNNVKKENDDDNTNNNNRNTANKAEEEEKKSWSRSLSPSVSSSSRRTRNRYMRHENYLIPHGTGTISMAAAHRSKVGSQFYLTLDESLSTTHLNRRFVVFGHVIFGYRTTLKAMELLAEVDSNTYAPRSPIVISACEVLPYSMEAELALAEKGLRTRKTRMVRDDHYSEEHLRKYQAEAEKLAAVDEEKISHSIAPEGSEGISQMMREQGRRVREENALLAKGPVPRDAFMQHQLGDTGLGVGGRKAHRQNPNQHWRQFVKDPRQKKEGDEEGVFESESDGGDINGKASRAERFRERREMLRKKREERMRKN